MEGFTMVKNEHLEQLTNELREVRALLNNLKPSKHTVEIPMTVPEVCENYKISKVNFHAKRQKGLLPSFKIFGKVYAYASEINALGTIKQR